MSGASIGGRGARVKGLVRKGLRGATGSVLALAVVLAGSTPAMANVEGEMNNFMNDMGAYGNVTGPGAFQGQSAGYYTAGNLWARFPQRNVQPFNLQLPHARAGCGGIDLFAGSFSFINTAELVAMLKATANNALGFAFKLAIDSISPEIGKVMDELAQKVQQMNQFNMNSCEQAQALVGGLWPRTDAASSEICKAVANTQGAVADWARARQQCNNGGQRESLKDGNTDNAMKVQPGMKVNYTWHALKTKYSGFDPDFREFLMNLVGTVIYDPAGVGDGSGQPRVASIQPGDAGMISKMLDGTGTSGPLTIQGCTDTDVCLTLTNKTVAINNTTAIRPRVKVLIQSMFDKARNGSALTPAEIQLLGLASVPVYKIVTVYAASEGNIDPTVVDQVSEIVAVDLLATMVMRFHELATKSSDTFEGADEASKAEWRDMLRDSRNNFRDISIRTSQRFDQVFALIQRTQMVEKQLKSQLTPKMVGALRFSRSVGGRM